MKKLLLLTLTLITLNVMSQDIVSYMSTTDNLTITPTGKPKVTSDPLFLKLKQFHTKVATVNLDLSTVEWKPVFKKFTKFATIYGAINGGTSLSDRDVFSVSNGLQTSTVETPYDYSVILGVRKIARMGYEPKEAFKNGLENSFSDASTIGKVKGFEYLFEFSYVRQEGENYTNQHHFLRYIADDYILKGEYLEDGFADIILRFVENEAKLCSGDGVTDEITLSMNTIPTLFIRGLKSGYVSDVDLEKLYDVYLQLEPANIEGAGHWTFHDQEAAVVAHMKPFLAR